MDDYKRGGHTKYAMRVHLILVTKYRHQIFSTR
jgi:REP element-mobilizing transposase RayT